MQEATTVQISKDTWEDLYRRKAFAKESMDSIIKTLIKNNTSGYKPEIEIESKRFLLKKIKSKLFKFSEDIKDLNKEIDEAIK